MQIATRAAADPEADYAVDGNRYLEAAGATIQLEHREGSTTVRVIEPSITSILASTP